MDWIIPQTTIEDDILKIEQSFINPIIVCHKVIRYSQQILETYREHIWKQDFESETQEIQFFKHHKQTPLSNIIQYSKQLKFELEFQNSVTEMVQDFVVKEIESINLLFSTHKEFLMYTSLECNHMDVFYFTRKHKDTYSYMPLQHRFDSGFNTSHDLLLATITANRRFLKFLQNKMRFSDSENQSLIESIKLHWTGSKAGLTELAVALKHSGVINHGNISLKEIIKIFQQIFGVDLGDYHHTAMRLKNRNNPTKFTDKLHHALAEHFSHLDN